MVEIVTKTKRQRLPKTQPYTKVNSYTLTLSKQQIITALLFIAEVTLHEVFVTPSVQKVRQTILWACFGFRYALLLLIIYDYIKLTVKDPVDRLIIDPERRYKYNPYELRRCSICVSTVQCSSHHCMTCNRCTEDFDHHCKYLNNCIGVRNYQYFIRLLIVFILFQLLSILMASWLLIENTLHSFLTQTNKWIIFGYIVFTGILMLVVAGLLGFHLYISCCANITTLQFISPPANTEKPNLNIIAVEPTPLSAQNFRKNFEDHGKRSNYAVNVISQNDRMEYYRK